MKVGALKNSTGPYLFPQESACHTHKKTYLPFYDFWMND